ncbi:MAG TPA: aldo/keto reductase [Ktedonobacteraceae bacterium]|nr:aldo/keto reductase [Ktedonobacteraceae bacterium]
MLEPLSLHPLGTTNLLVPSLCVGCAALGDMPGTFAYSVAEAQALATIRDIFDDPISFADTAASYGDGESERLIGMVLRERGGLPPGFVLYYCWYQRAGALTGNCEVGPTSPAG